MRQIHNHKVNGLNEALTITATDQPGPGGANHRYDITGVDTATNPSATLPDGFKASFSRTVLIFQNGPIGEAGFNGLSNESLQAILIDRMRGFQHCRKSDGEFDFDTGGKYACKSNADALFHMEKALEALQSRTRDRMTQGIEGTHAVSAATPASPLRCSSYAELAAAFNSGALSRENYVLILDKGGRENTLSWRGPTSDEDDDRLNDEASAIFNCNSDAVESMLEALGIPHEWC